MGMSMQKINKHIEIVRTTRARYSSMGDASAHKIQAVLSKKYKQVNISVVNTAEDLEQLVQRQPDLVFLGLKRLPVSNIEKPGLAADIWLPEYLDRKGINYTGSAKSAIMLDFNKAEAKNAATTAGLSTAPAFTALPSQYREEGRLPLPLPLFVKPLDTGGGNGVGDDSVVRSFAEFEAKVATIFDTFGSSSLVEQYLTGREFSVTILEAADESEPAIMPIEIITEKNSRGDRVLGSRVKHEDNEQVVAVNDTAIAATVNALAINIYNTLGARDFARIDIRMDDRGVAYFLEANFMPAPGSRYFTGACQINEGLNYQDVILAIADLGLGRVEPLVVFEPSLAENTLLLALTPTFEGV